jgi:superfamily II DNA or RNA helicase
MPGRDAIALNRHHLHHNENVYKKTAELVKWSVGNGIPTLILVDEATQINGIYQVLREMVVEGKIRFAHSGLSPKAKPDVDAIFHKSDPTKLVEQFDAGEFPVLVGTQCIGVGTDIKTAGFGVDLVGLTSEVRLRQNIGRFTRRSAKKTSFEYVDFDVWNVPIIHGQAVKRAEIMNNIYGPVQFVGG